jgi:hypothetical protein
MVTMQWSGVEWRNERRQQSLNRSIARCGLTLSLSIVFLDRIMADSYSTKFRMFLLLWLLSPPRLEEGELMLQQFVSDK